MTEQYVNQQKEKLQTVSRQDMTQELATCGQTETVLLNVNEIGFIEKEPVNIKAIQYTELTEFALVNTRCSIKNLLRYWSD